MMQNTFHASQMPEWENRAEGNLQPGKIEIWKAELTGREGEQEKFFASLSDTEKERVGRYRIEESRRRFNTAHGILREILGVYLGQPAAAVEYESLESGKPVLAGSSSTIHPGLRFNISHSEDVLVIALSQEYELGIDVEWIKPGYNHELISRHFFAQDEKESLQSIPAELQAEAFFRLWTCKEAVLKGAGSGLRQKLDEVKIEFTPGADLARCVLPAGKGRTDAWSIFTFAPEDRYTAALAYKQDASAANKPLLNFFRWVG